MEQVETLLPVLALLATSIALASVFAYYPLNVTISPQTPSVHLLPGSNAGQADLGNKEISVTIGAKNTSAVISINPTYQETYYKDVLRVFNNDTKAMNVSVIFTSISNSLPQGSVVKLFFYNDTTKVKELTITSPQLNTPINIGIIGYGKTWQIDIYVYIPENTIIDGASYTASIRLVYTPSSEVPPATPASGR